MKIITSEFGHSYETYSFAYTIYAKREKEDDLASIYEKGFLPFSGAKDVYDMFYMARSIRSYVRTWEPTSENRRVLKKFDGEFTKHSRTVEDVRHDEGFFDLCLSYFNLAHGNVMPLERLELILDTNLISRVIEYRKDATPVAYLLLVEGENFSHYWFSFFKQEYTRSALGMWLALDHIREMQGKKDYFYFGTGYAEKALYKTNVEPLSFWNGTEWVHDVKLLKALCRSDTIRHIDNHKDAFKAHLELF
ncbi:MAG: Acetyltransf 6 protein [Patescibacteria group bacterium]|nr:Acetyltransf 6 protein [Patescibacteria group bacterium]